MPELPDITVYLEALESASSGRRSSASCSRILSCCAPPSLRCNRARVTASSALRRLGKRIAIGFDKRSVAADPSDDRRAAALVRQERTRGTVRASLLHLEFDERHADADRGRHEAARVAACRSQRGAARRSRSRRPRSARRRSSAFRERLSAHQPHAEARADRSDDPERRRQRVLGRNPASRPPLAARCRRAT